MLSPFAGLSEFSHARGVGATPSNWWEAGGATGCLSAYDAKNAANYAASKVNLSNPGTFNATEGDAPTWTAGIGWDFNGSSNYLILPSLTPSNNWSVLCRFSTGASFGIYNAAGDRWGINNAGGGNTVVYFNGANNTGGINSGGNEAMAGVDCYKNGVADGSVAGTYTNVPWSIYLGAINLVDVVPLFFTAGTIIAIAFYDNTLSSGKITDLVAAMAAL